MPIEKSIENSCIDYAKKNGWLYRKVAYKGRAGAPDRWFLKGGIWVLIEFKQEGGVLSKLQELDHADLEKHGQHVHVCWSVAQFKETLDWYDHGLL